MTAFAAKMESLSAALQDPEYLFLLLEPLLFYGIAFGVVLFLVTLFMKVEKFQVVALVFIAAAALTVIPYTGARKSAQDRIAQVYKIESPSRVRGFQEISENRAAHRWVYLLLAGLAGATILVGPRRNRLGLGLAVGSVAVGIYLANYGLWMHYQESLVYHPNLKNHEAPVREKIDRSRPADDTPPDRSSPANDDNRSNPRNVRPITTAERGSG